MIEDDFANRIEALESRERILAHDPERIQERMAKLRAKRLKDDYFKFHTPDPTREEIAEGKAEAEARGDEPIVVDLDALQDPFDLRAGIVQAPRYGNLNPDIEREAVRRMDEAHREGSDRIERLRDRGTIRNGPPWHRVRRGAGFVDIPPTDYEFAQWRKGRGRREWEEPPYALPGESFEHAAKRHLGLQRSSELLEMQERTRAEIRPQEISDPFKVRDEPRTARADQPQTWDSGGEEQSRLARFARSVGIKTKKNRSQSKQARAQKRDEHGRFAS